MNDEAQIAGTIHAHARNRNRGEVGGRRSEGKDGTSNRNSVGVSSERTEDGERERGRTTLETLKKLTISGWAQKFYLRYVKHSFII